MDKTKVISRITAFYSPSGKAISIAFVRNGCEARYYTHSFTRFIKISNMINWQTYYTKQAISMYNPNYIRNEV